MVDRSNAALAKSQQGKRAFPPRTNLSDIQKRLAATRIQPQRVVINPAAELLRMAAEQISCRPETHEPGSWNEKLKKKGKKKKLNSEIDREKSFQSHESASQKHVGAFLDVFGGQSSRSILSNKTERVSLSLSGGRSGREFHVKSEESASKSTIKRQESEFVKLQQEGKLRSSRLAAQRRVDKLRAEFIKSRREDMEKAVEKKERNEVLAKENSKKAEERILARIKYEQAMEEARIEDLIAQQQTSIEALILSRFISPRFEEVFRLEPPFRKEMDERVRKILERVE